MKKIMILPTALLAIVAALSLTATFSSVIFALNVTTVMISQTPDFITLISWLYIVLAMFSLFVGVTCIVTIVKIFKGTNPVARTLGLTSMYLYTELCFTVFLLPMMGSMFAEKTGGLYDKIVKLHMNAYMFFARFGGGTLLLAVGIAAGLAGVVSGFIIKLKGGKVTGLIFSAIGLILHLTIIAIAVLLIRHK